MLIRLPDVLSADELAKLDALFAGMRFEDGTATAGSAARDVKQNRQAVERQPNIDPARKLVTAALSRCEAFLDHTLPLRLVPPLFSVYEPGMRYGAHTDNALMSLPLVRTDVAVTLFVSSPTDYDGGELVIEADGAAQSIKLAAGSAVAYSATTVHHVAPVTRGKRRAAVTWVQSLVRDDAQREVLLDLQLALRRLRDLAPDARETLLLSKARANLLRMWSEP